jgi:hypothetical protein
MNFGLRLRRDFTETLIKSRFIRIGFLFLTWLLVREASLSTSGFRNGPVICPIRLFLGIPCPGCGGTRSLGAICEGDFESAWNLNPLSFVFVLAAIIWALKSNAITKYYQSIQNIFLLKSRAFQISTLVFLYGIAWIAAIYRFNSGIV